MTRIIIALIFLLSVIDGASSATWTAAVPFRPDSDLFNDLSRLSETIKEATHGEITLFVRPYNSGEAAEVIDSVQSGDVQIAVMMPHNLSLLNSNLDALGSWYFHSRYSDVRQITQATMPFLTDQLAQKSLAVAFTVPPEPLGLFSVAELPNEDSLEQMSFAAFDPITEQIITDMGGEIKTRNLEDFENAISVAYTEAFLLSADDALSSKISSDYQYFYDAHILTLPMYALTQTSTLAHPEAAQVEAILRWYEAASWETAESRSARSIQDMLHDGWEGLKIKRLPSRVKDVLIRARGNALRAVERKISEAWEDTKKAAVERYAEARALVRELWEELEQPVTCDTTEVWYATNRLALPRERWEYAQYSDDGAADEMSYGVSTVLAPRPGGAGESPCPTGEHLETFCGDVTTHTCFLKEERSKEGFYDVIVGQAAESDRSLSYVHGYTATLDQATGDAARLARQMRLEYPPVVFSWPSGGAQFPGDYEDAQEVARTSSSALKEMIREVNLRAGVTPDLMTHSMGARVLVGSMSADDRSGRGVMEAEDVMMVAPEVAGSELRAGLDEGKVRFEALTVYVSKVDCALLAAEWKNGDSAVGLRPPIFWDRRVVTVDATKTLREPGNRDSCGHSYHIYAPHMGIELAEATQGIPAERRSFLERQSDAGGATYFVYEWGKEGVAP